MYSDVNESQVGVTELMASFCWVHKYYTVRWYTDLLMACISIRLRATLMEVYISIISRVRFCSGGTVIR